MKRVYWQGTGKSYTGATHAFTQRKPFNDMTDEEAKIYENRWDFRVTESPKYSKIENSEEYEEEFEDEELDSEEENDEEENDEVKKKKKIIKKVKK